MAKSEAKDGIKKRGFASMPEEKRKKLASLGGKASSESGRGHKFTEEEAREAGRKGGKSKKKQKK